MINRLLGLARDSSGAATIELALVAPILAMMVVGVADISTAFGKKLELEQAAQRAIEKVAQTTGEKTPEDTIKDEAACQYNGVDENGDCRTDPLTAGEVIVTYTLECDGTAQDFSTDCTAGQTEYRYIQASLTDTYTAMFPIHFGTADGTYELNATAGVRVQ